MLSGVQIGRIAGIRLYAHWSLLVIFGLIALSLAAGVFPTWHPTWSTSMCWTVAIASAVLFFGSIAAHELAHALVGRRQGIPVEGITLFIFGGMAHTTRYPPSARAELWMAAVGPLTSLLIGVIATYLGSLLIGSDATTPQQVILNAGPVATLLLWLGPINIILAVFNMVPGFPLDGGRVLRAALWWASGDLSKATHWASAVGRGFGWLLIATGFLMALGMSIPLFGTGFVGGLWLVLIGWFVSNAAQFSYRQVLIHEALDDVPVRAVMRTQVASVEPDTTIDSLVSDYYMNNDQQAFPVKRGDELWGLVAMDRVRTIPRDQWASTCAQDIMIPVASLHGMQPSAPALEALARLGQEDLEQIPVIENHKLLGLVRRQDIVKWLSLGGAT